MAPIKSNANTVHGLFRNRKFKKGFISKWKRSNLWPNNYVTDVYMYFNSILHRPCRCPLSIISASVIFFPPMLIMDLCNDCIFIIKKSNIFFF